MINQTRHVDKLPLVTDKCSGKNRRKVTIDDFPDEVNRRKVEQMTFLTRKTE